MPSLKLSDRAIAQLRPTGKQTFYWDTALTGLAVLVSAHTDVKTYMAKGQLNGRGVVKSLGKTNVMTLTEARQAARELLRDLGAGIDPRRQQRSALTLSAVLAAYLDAQACGATSPTGLTCRCEI